MTSKVTVDAHAGWPMKVIIEDKKQDDPDKDVWVAAREQIVAPLATETIYVTNTRRIIVEEMKKDD